MRIVIALMGLLCAARALAAEPAPSLIFPYIEGRDYVTLEKPVPTAHPSKIEVVEVFSYICPHCFHFEPLLNAWMKQQQADVELVRIHAAWGGSMTAYQRGFYTAETLKLQEKTHGAIFNRIHVEQKMLPDAEAWASFFAGYGVTKAQALSTYNSAAVTEQMKRASEAFKNYQISGTPELVVDGKYRISSRFTGAQEDMLKVIQFLVNKARVEHTAKK